jgi:hypothetical protein
MRQKAVPIAVLLRGNPDELAKYAPQPLTPQELKERKAEEAEYKKRTKASEYADNRRSEYPAITEQLDEIWKILNGSPSEMPALIKAIKERHPKPKEKK